MASDTTSGVPDARRDGAGGIAAHWLSFLREHVNLDALDERAKKPVRVLVAGSRAPELLAALDPDGNARAGALERFEDAQAWDVADKATRAVLFFGSHDEEEAARERLAALALPASIVKATPLPDDLGRGIFTAPPAHGHARPGVPASYPVASLDPVELRKHLLHDVAREYHDRLVALGAALPVFRPVVAARLTVDCATNSMKIAALSALADHIPVIGIVTGAVASAGDTIAITTLQGNMLLNIAAVYGKPAGYARIAELLPVIGGGYGWRALARELSGFIPGVGVIVKAAIAYAGSLIVGQAAAYYYETGRPMAPDKMHTLYREATDRAKDLAADVARRLKRK